MKVISRCWLQLLFVCSLFSVSFLANGAELAGSFSQELTSASYDCNLTLNIDKKSSTNAQLSLSLEWAENADFVQLDISRKSIKVYRVSNDKRVSFGSFIPTITPASDYHISIIRRGISLGVMENDRMIFRKDVPRGAGSEAGISGDPGWKIVDSAVQRLDPVVFSDDFMRVDEDPGRWKIVSGSWMLKSAWDNSPNGSHQQFLNTIFAQNPFAWVGSCPAGVASALCTTGETFWEDYSYTINVRPAAGGAVGVAVNMLDAKNGIFIRWSPVNDRTVRGNKLIMYRVTDGKAIAQLAESSGGYLPGQWYKITVLSTLSGISVLIDGIERIKKPAITPWRGAVGLYVEGLQSAIFDDISVRGQALNSDLLFEMEQTQINQRFEVDLNGMKNWSDIRTDWIPTANLAGHYWFRREMYGDHIWMVSTFKPRPNEGGEFWMTLDGDGKNPGSGYRAQINVASAGVKPTYTLYRDGDKLASVDGNELLDPANEYTFRFWRTENDLHLEVDDETVISANNVEPVKGRISAYRATGTFLNANEVYVMSHNMLDYTFSGAPADWLTDGTWLPTIRWSCEPKWSFLAGWSRGPAMMWHKERFTGDHSINAFVGIKMEIPRERQAYAARYRDLAVTICGDGTSEKSGYSGIFAYSGNGTPPNMVIMREGKIVAEKALPPDMIPSQGANHRTWFELTLALRDRVIDFNVRWLIPQGNQNGLIKDTSLAYTDPQPITSGIPAIWTQNNGISIARARLNFAENPAPRTEPILCIDDPYLPEWANVNIPLDLDFSNSFSTSGKAVKMIVTPRDVPAGDEMSAKVIGTTVSLTAKVAASKESNQSRDAREHWYQIVATDGQNFSPRYQLALQVFDPSIGRDDSHALLLYRFTAGKNAIVEDESPIAPKVNLTINNLPNSNQLSAHWLPGQGLAVNRESSVASTTSADKLLAIAKSNAMTLECWFSSETLYPRADATNWNSVLFSWDNQGKSDGTKRNLTIAQSTSTLLMAPFNRAPFQNGNIQRASGIRIGLQHVMITWDGKTTFVYIDGVKIQTLNINWQTNQWVTESGIILGNCAKGTNPQVGSFYLIAVHDRCFTDQEVTNQYQAGPSAHDLK